jgi:hypothetical protein
MMFIFLSPNYNYVYGYYRQDSDWLLDLLTAYTLTTHDYTLQIIDIHRLVSSVSTCRFLATDFHKYHT